VGVPSFGELVNFFGFTNLPAGAPFLEFFRFFGITRGGALFGKKDFPKF